MGLLDDAIREHLELKRKHGADPADVARQEQEALGPGSQFAPQGTVPETAEPEPPVDELPEGEPGIQEEPPGPEAPGYEEDPWLAEERDEVPAEEALQQPRADGAEEDVLEETPDFLQETPEHD